MEFDEYQNLAAQAAVYPRVGENLAYTILGLTGEAGEVANKVKKIERDGSYNASDIASELGDVLWYVAMAAQELGFTLQDVAEGNLLKIERRLENGTLRGSGDER